MARTGDLSPAPALAGRLDAARRAVEGRFLEAGDVLSHAVEGVGRLIGSLEALASTLEPATVEATTGQLRLAADDLSALPDRHGARRELVERMIGAGRGLTGCIGDMRRTLAYLQTYAINIKITAGGIAAARSEFGVFTQEVHDRIERGRRELDAFDADLSALCADLAAALAQERDLAAHLDGLVPAVPDGLAASAREMVEHHERISEAAGEVAGLARQVQKKVGGVLAALQIGDITRQRIEHVQHALELTGAVGGLSPEARGRLEAFVHQLLAAQLAATAEDFERDVARIGANMAGMAGDAAEILRLRDLAFGRQGADGQSFLKRMESYVGQALGLVDRLAQADVAALELGRSAAAAAGDLTAKVTNLQSIKTDVQQMALNATLKCARIGDPGKPLAVIAVELRHHAGHMETSSQQALEALDGMAAEAAGLAGDGGIEPEAAPGAGAALADAVDRLRSVGASVEADLVELARQGEAVVDALRRAAARLDFHSEIGAIIRQAAADLAATAGEDAPWIDDVRAPLAELLQAIARDYTMASEREVHQAMTRGRDLDAAPAAEAPAAKPAAAAKEDEFDDVLF
ncbi:MAG: hypothetical protein ACK4YQ_06475 [Phenylobacterium sp.]|uniref:hypothetical protein n=1 Tax=Phenylobacterium sp. TaxID=1871053 RepID=UPI003919294C